MHVLFIEIVLHIPYAQSLKDKRSQVRSLKDRLTSRFNASVAEIDSMDSWQSAVIGMCMLSTDRSYLEKQYGLIEALVLEYTGLELVTMRREWL